MTFTPPLSRADMEREIAKFAAAKHLSSAMKPEELGALSGLERVLALRNSLILGLVRHCRSNPKADTRIPVYCLITFLADNEDGICRLSVARMAEVFKRSERAIHASIASLKEDGLIGTDGEKGWSHSYWPLVPTVFSELVAKPIWFVDALSPKRRVRLPRTMHEKDAHEVEVTPEEQDRGGQQPPSPLKSSTATPEVQRTEPLKSSAATPEEQHTHSNISLTGESAKGDLANPELANGCGTHARAVDGQAALVLDGQDLDGQDHDLGVIDEADCVQFHRQYNSWGRKTDRGKQHDRSVTDASLRSLVRAHREIAKHSSVPVQTALSEALTRCGAMIAAGDVRNSGPAAYTSYLARALHGLIHNGLQQLAEDDANIKRAKDPYTLRNGRANASAVNAAMMRNAVEYPQ